MEIFVKYNSNIISADVSESDDVDTLLERIRENLYLSSRLPLVIEHENGIVISDIEEISCSDTVYLRLKDVKLLSGEDIKNLLDTDEYGGIFIDLEMEYENDSIDQHGLQDMIHNEEDSEILLYKFKAYVEYVLRYVKDDDPINTIVGHPRYVSMLCVVCEYILDNKIKNIDDSSFKMIDYLLDNGANIDIINHDYRLDLFYQEDIGQCDDFTVLLMALYYEWNESEEKTLSNYLLDKGASMDTIVHVTIYDDDSIKEMTVSEFIQN